MGLRFGRFLMIILNRFGARSRVAIDLADSWWFGRLSRINDPWRNRVRTHNLVPQLKQWRFGRFLMIWAFVLNQSAVTSQLALLYTMWLISPSKRTIVWPTTWFSKGICQLVVKNLGYFVQDEVIPAFPTMSHSRDRVQQAQEGESLLKTLRRTWDDHVGSMDILKYMVRSLPIYFIC